MFRLLQFFLLRGSARETNEFPCSSLEITSIILGIIYYLRVNLYNERFFFRAHRSNAGDKLRSISDYIKLNHVGRKSNESTEEFFFMRFH